MVRTIFWIFKNRFRFQKTVFPFQDTESTLKKQPFQITGFPCWILVTILKHKILKPYCPSVHHKSAPIALMVQNFNLYYIPNQNIYKSPSIKKLIIKDFFKDAERYSIRVQKGAENAAESFTWWCEVMFWLKWAKSSENDSFLV